MPSKIFETLLSEKVDHFIDSFKNLSREIFYDEETKRLTHSLEYGIMRESICREFLKFIIPSGLEIQDGFIISSANSVSTQCDLVIFDSKNTPLYETGKRQRFFHVETVAGIGEVKSVLSKQDFRETINELARIKKIRKDNKTPSIINRKPNEPFENYKHPFDQLFSFIICEKLDFKLTNLPAEFNMLYDSDVEYSDRHNLILSIDDGLCLYKHTVNGKVKAWHYPFSKSNNLKNRFISPGDNGRNHFNGFATYMFMGIQSTTIFFPEFRNYAGEQVKGYYTDEI
ncbi:MAG: hypothetical protein O9294_11860 [Cytophagales bacterium]|jgi:hypothetical protein|nr:hypothetical protein [Cytophagales bacterium]